jgi:hypothetical protein
MFTSQHHLSATDDVYIVLFCEILLHKYHIDGKHVRVYHSRICQQTSFLAMAISKYGALIPCSFCDSKINIYIYWLSRLCIYHYFEYVDCNIWFLALLSLAKLHPFNAHIWKSPSPKSLFVDKYENDTHEHILHVLSSSSVGSTPFFQYTCASADCHY